MSADAKLNLPTQSIDTADGKAKELLTHAKAQTGFVPNMYALMANSPGLLDTYLLGYRHFREESDFAPVEQEVVLLTISRFHGCTYCMAAHSMIAAKVSKVPEEVLSAIRNRQALPDPKLAALSRFTEIMLQERGRPTPEQLDTLKGRATTTGTSSRSSWPSR